MTAETKTAGERATDKTAISHPHEREALVLLANAGWSRSELAMVFEVSQSTIDRTIAAETGGQR